MVCKEQSRTEDEQPFNVVGKLCLKDLSSDHNSKNKNKIAHKTESTDELFLNSHQQKGAQKVNNDIDVLMSEIWPSFPQFHNVNEVCDYPICTEPNSFVAIAEKLDLEDFRGIPLRYYCVTGYEEADIFLQTITKLYNSKLSQSICVLTYPSDIVTKNTSSTTLNITINSSELYMSEDWAEGLVDDLAKNTSLTTLSLTINSSELHMSDDWAKGLGDGLAINASLTTLSLTIDSSELYMSEDWAKDLGDGLARNTSLTTLSLTIKSTELHMSEDWAKCLGDSLAKNTSVTTLSLSINSSSLYISEDWGKSLGDGLAKNTSLTTAA